MWKIIEKILNKPENERRHIVFVTATFLTVLIVIVWLSFLYARYLNASDRRSVQHTASPFEIFSKEVQGRFEEVTKNYEDLSNTLGEVNSLLENMATSSLSTTSSENINESSSTETTSEQFVPSTTKQENL